MRTCWGVGRTTRRNCFSSTYLTEGCLLILSSPLPGKSILCASYSLPMVTRLYCLLAVYNRLIFKFQTFPSSISHMHTHHSASLWDVSKVCSRGHLTLQSTGDAPLSHAGQVADAYLGLPTLLSPSWSRALGLVPTKHRVSYVQDMDTQCGVAGVVSIF